MAENERRRLQVGSWVSTTYFAEGFPYSLVNNLAEVLFKELGATVQVIGLTSLFHLPWNLKFLWGPFVDGYETKRRWLLACEVLCVVLIAAITLLSAGPVAALAMLAAAFLILGLVSATHDVAIDGYYLEALSPAEQSAWVGFRAAAYRVAMLAVGGPMLWLCDNVGWTFALACSGVLMALLLGYHALLLPQAEARKASWTKMLAPLWSWRTLPWLAVLFLLWFVEHSYASWTALRYEVGDFVRPRPSLVAIRGALDDGAWAAVLLLLALVAGLALLPWWRKRASARQEQVSAYASSFLSFLAQPRVGVILAFVILFRTGESFLQKMRWPFLDDVVHLPLGQFGMVNGTVGVIASFMATILGGYLISRHGLRRWIWPFVLGQNLLNLLYVGLALAPAAWFPTDPVAAEELAFGMPHLMVGGVIVAEHIGAGFGTAVFMVYIMRACAPEHKAGHMAIVTALMSVSFTIAGVLSGFIQVQLGWSNYFVFTFLATVPSMLLIPFVPYLDGRPDTTTESETS